MGGSRLGRLQWCVEDTSGQSAANGVDSEGDGDEDGVAELDDLSPEDSGPASNYGCPVCRDDQIHIEPGNCICFPLQVEFAGVCEDRATCAPTQEYYPPTNTCMGTAFHAGTCPRGLGSLPEPLGIVRHDDVHTYYSSESGNSSVRTSEESIGFYAQNETIAVRDALIYLATAQKIYSPGVYQRTYDSSCGLQAVSRSKYDRIKGRSSWVSHRWRNYHLLTRNCQHWADYIVNETQYSL